VATGGLLPDLTLVLDMPAAAAAARDPPPLGPHGAAGRRVPMPAVREGFLAEAARRPGEIVVLDAARPIEQIQADIRAAVERMNADR